MRPDQLQVRHRFVDLPRLKLHLVEAGEGPLVLLLHGFPESWWSWRYQLEPLARAGYRVVAPDLRGYGESGRQGPYDLDTLAADVCALIDALGAEPAPVVVGHDWGGAVAWHLAAHRPEHCRRLAVLNCPHPARMREALLTRPRWSQLKRSWYMFFFGLPWLPEWLLTRDRAGGLVRVMRASAVDRTNFGLEELEPLRQAILAPGAASAMVGWYRAALWDGLGHPLRPPRYPPIGCPSLLIWGLDDPALGFDDVVPGTEALAPGLAIERIPGCGHFVQAEQPERVNQLLLRFLAG